MNHSIRACLPMVLLVASLALVAAVTAAEGPAWVGGATPEPTARSWDAQSTTGPVPPAGLDVRGLSTVSEAAVVISGVPAYEWRHGCGPTAAGMVLGYWDGRGFDALLPGDASTQTAAVNNAIASEGPASNYTDYCLPIDYYPNLQPDKSEAPAGDEHADNCLADYMKTSQSRHWNYYGWSWSSDIGPALAGYVRALGRDDYTVTVADSYVGADVDVAWLRFRAEIDARRPVVLLVDTDGNGSTDHFVTGIGYDVVGGSRRYACLNTWDRQAHWYDFRPMAQGTPWGIYCWTTFALASRATPTATVTRTPTRTPTPNLTPMSEHLSLPLVLRLAVRDESASLTLLHP